MTAQTYDPNTRLDDLHPSRFLKVSDLLERWHVQQITVTISRLEPEDTIPNPKDIDPATKKPRIEAQPVLYFQTKAGAPFPRGYLLAAQVDVQSLKSATKAETIAEVLGKKIVILVGEHRGKAVLRISAMPPME